MIDDLVKEIKGRSYAGSSTRDGKLYHDLPFPGLEKYSSHRSRTKQRIDHICKLVDVKDKKILDIGCSVGGLTLGMAQNGAKLAIGVDYDQQSINVAKRAKKLIGALNSSFYCEETDLAWTKRINKFNIIIWMSHWMWMVKEYGMEIAKQMLFEVSRKTDVMIFESASDDGMARIKGSTQDDIEKWLFENTAFRSIKRVSSVGGWLHRDIFVCTRPLVILDGHKRATTSIIERVSPTLIKKTYREGYEWMQEREARALKMLEDYSFFPKLRDQGDGYIVMDYVGRHEYVNSDMVCQARKIVQILDREKIRHRDVKHSNLLTLNNKLYLIDFGWCLFEGEDDTPVKAPVHLHGNSFGSDEDMMRRIFPNV